MDLTQQEDQLFEQWRTSLQDPGFVPDGAVDPTAYWASEPRIVLLLKEVNDPDRGGWDLRDYLRQGGRDETWNVVCRWVAGLRSLPTEVPWQQLEEVTAAQRTAVLRSIVAMNLSKTPGGHTTDGGKWWAAVERDQAFVRAQLALYRPDLVICCGSIVADAFSVFIWRGTQPPPWQETTRGVRHLRCDEGAVVVRYCHPEARVSASLIHYGLIDAISEALPGQP